MEHTKQPGLQSPQLMWHLTAALYRVQQLQATLYAIQHCCALAGTVGRIQQGHPARCTAMWWYSTCRADRCTSMLSSVNINRSKQTDKGSALAGTEGGTQGEASPSAWSSPAELATESRCYLVWIQTAPAANHLHSWSIYLDAPS
jgi:hypothetical protein